MCNLDKLKVVLAYPFYSMVRGLYIDYPGHTVAWYTKTMREQYLRQTNQMVEFDEEDVYRIRVLVLQSKPTDLAGKITQRVLLGDYVEPTEYPEEQPDAVEALIRIALNLRGRLTTMRGYFLDMSATLDTLNVPEVTSGAYMGYRECFSRKSEIGGLLRRLNKTFISGNCLVRHPPEVIYDDNGKDLIPLRFKLVRYDHQGCWILPHVVIKGGLYGLTASNFPILMREYK